MTDLKGEFEKYCIDDSQLRSYKSQKKADMIESLMGLFSESTKCRIDSYFKCPRAPSGLSQQPEAAAEPPAKKLN